MIQVTDLVKRYPAPDGSGPQAAVDSVSFGIDRGEIFGILGPNGAGKTSTLEMLEGLREIDGGSALIDGIDVATKPFEVKRIIGVQLQSSEYFEHLNLTELLELFIGLYGQGMSPAALLALVQLEEKAKAKPADLSGGQYQRFTIACALANQPTVLFLDEPTTGLDPVAKRNLWQLVRKLNAEGMTIVLTTHNMEEAAELCHRVAIMDRGCIVALGTPAELVATHAPEPPAAPRTGNLEDVFLAVTGHTLTGAGA